MTDEATGASAAKSGFALIKYYDADKARKDLSTYHADINMDFMQQAGMFAYWAAKLVQAERQHARIEYALERAEAARDREIRSQAAAAGKKMTEGSIKAEIATDRALIRVRELLLEAREEMGMLKAVCEGLRQRKDMLIQMGNQAREELKGSPQIMHGANKENRNERLKTLAAYNSHIEIE